MRVFSTASTNLESLIPCLRPTFMVTFTNLGTALMLVSPNSFFRAGTTSFSYFSCIRVFCICSLNCFPAFLADSDLFAALAFALEGLHADPSRLGTLRTDQLYVSDVK